MGLTVSPVMFVDSEFAIEPHTASFACHIGKPVKLKDFSPSGMAKVSKIEETGDYVFECGGYFAEGPPV